MSVTFVYCKYVTFFFYFTGNYNEEIVSSLRSDSGLLKRGEAEKLRELSKLKYMYFAL